MKITISNVLLFLIFFGLIIISCSNSYLQKTELVKKNSLSKNFKSSFFIGAAINEDQILGNDKQSLNIIENEFNTITAENCMKWVFLQPEPNVFDFKLSDKYVALGKRNKMQIVGHTLVWHSQAPDYINNINDVKLLSTYMENHIKTVVTRYKDDVASWDVVNEALNEDGTLRESIYLKLLGENYLEKAFKLAEKADSNADLNYNDYNLCEPEKREGAIKLIKNLKENGAKITGIGLQAHWNLNTPSLEEIEKSILSFSALGVKVMFTELDISVLPNPWDLEGADVNQNFEKFEGDKKMNPYPKKLPESVQIQLAKRYKDIFKLFLKHEDKISRVTFWGVTDKHSWLNDWPIKGRTNYPLLFDKKYQPKKAYESLLNLKK